MNTAGKPTDAAVHVIPQRQPGFGSLGRPMPSSITAEEHVLGGVLFAGLRPWYEVAALLRAEDFYHPGHAAIFEACAACEQTRQPIDLLTVGAKLAESGTMSSLVFLGSEGYLAELANKVATVENIAAHAQLVADSALARRLILAAGEIAASAYRGGSGADLLDSAQSRLFDLGGNYQRLSEPKTLRSLVHKAVQRLEDRYLNKTVVTGVPTGFAAMDNLTNGWQDGNLIVIMGRPAHGKSALAMQSAAHAAIAERIPTLVFHLEMTEDEVTDRLLSSDARVPGQAIRTGYLTSPQWIQIAKTAARLAEGPMWVDDDESLTLAALAAKARRWRSNPRIFPPGKQVRGLIVLDYLQLMQAVAGRGKSREQEVSELSRGLKRLAKQLRLPIVAVASLSRKCEERVDKRPHSADLRESGNIESDANLVVGVYRDDLYDPNSPDAGLAEILIRKHRGGPTGSFRLTWDGPTTLFGDFEAEGAAK